jgi:very-short-patch-repair endonuclease
VHVTVCGRQVSRPKIVVRSIGRDETMTIEGIPATTPSRTVLDLAAKVSSAQLERLVAEAFARNLTSRPRLLMLVDRYSRRPGTPALRALLEADSKPIDTRSPPERRMLALLRRAELPLPQVNADLYGYVADFLWAEQRLVVEVDPYATHSSPSSFERDRRKDADLVLRGYRVIRISWRQLRDRPEAVAARLGQALAGGAAK